MPIPALLSVATKLAAITALLLLVPLIAMQFTDEGSWGIGDFVAAGCLLFAAGMAYALGARRARSGPQRALIALLVLATLGIVWAELAVGLFS